MQLVEVLGILCAHNTQEKQQLFKIAVIMAGGYPLKNKMRFFGVIADPSNIKVEHVKANKKQLTVKYLNCIEFLLNKQEINK